MNCETDTWSEKEIYFNRRAYATDDDGDGGVAYYTAETELDKEDVENWANNYFGAGESCGHTHDCCGCWFTSSVWVAKKYDLIDYDGKPDRGYIIEINSGRNV